MDVSMNDMWGSHGVFKPLQASQFPPSMVARPVSCSTNIGAWPLVLSVTISCIRMRPFGNIHMEFGDSDKYEYKNQQLQSLFHMWTYTALLVTMKVITTISKQLRQSNFLVITCISTDIGIQVF